MDDTLLFIPPCCVDNKLPKAVLQAPNRNLTFYTHGDVTMEKFYRAIAYLIEGPQVMVLTMSVLSAENVVFFQQCFERKWISHLVLSVGYSASEMLIDRYLSKYKCRILFLQHTNATDSASHMVLYSKEKALVLTGPMFNRVRCSGVFAYSMTFYPSMALFSDKFDWGNPLRNALFPDVLRYRQVVKKQKSAIVSVVLNKFLRMEFPPYSEDE